MLSSGSPIITRCGSRTRPGSDRSLPPGAAAAGLGVRLLVCPEIFLTGYNLEPAAMTRLGEAPDGPAARRISEIARTNSRAILYGYAENDGGAIYKAAQPMDPRGRPLANYRKSHQYGDLEHRWFSPGNALEVTELDGSPVGILICYEIEFPQPARTLALDGAAMELVPTRSPSPAASSPIRWCRRGPGKTSSSPCMRTAADPRETSTMWA